MCGGGLRETFTHMSSRPKLKARLYLVSDSL